MSVSSLDSLVKKGRAIKELCSSHYASLEKALSCHQAASGINKRVDFDSEPGLAFLKSPILTGYHYYPYLFVHAFPGVSEPATQTIAVWGRLYLDYLLITDRIMDGQRPLAPLVLQVSDLLHERAMVLLYSVFVSGSEYWACFERYRYEYARAVLLESGRHTGTLTPYPEPEFARIASGKSAMAKASATALAILSDAQHTIEPLAQSHDRFAVASQLYDDLKDWKEDYRDGRYSYLLTTLLYENDLATVVSEGQCPEVKEIGRLLYYSGLAEQTLERASSLCEEAVDALSDLDCPYWVQHIRSMQDRINRLKMDLNEIRTLFGFSSGHFFPVGALR